jgi:DNA-binding Lrp family transcriptional regulator
MEKGRPRKEVDTDILFDLIEKGGSNKDIAAELGMSSNTLSLRITEIQEKQGLILQYRALQNLHLTELQANILEHITADKIEEAPLRDLVFAYKVLKDKELVEIGKPTDIKGMMHYLVELERQEMAVDEPVKDITKDADSIIDLKETEDGEFKDLKEVMPKL